MISEADFDLSLALGGSYTPDSLERGTDCLEVVKHGGGVSEALSCDDGLEVEVSRALGMRQVANIIIALKRMKHSEHVMSTEFTDHELLNIMMESVFEEHVIMDVQDPTCSNGSTFWRSPAHVDVVHSVCDSEQKKLVLSSDNSELHAMALQTMTLQNNEFYKRIVKLKLSTYNAIHISANQGQPVALGIANTNLYMSCAEAKSGAPFLQLEKVDNKDKLGKIYAQGEKERFLFFKRGSGFAFTTFESAKFKGWYISTIPACNAPVEMCTKMAANHLTTFMVKRTESTDQGFI